MSSIELEAGLIEKAVEERNTIITEAESRAERILENARLEKARIENDVERHLRTIVGSELRAVHDRIVGRANLDGRKMIMEAKMGLLETVFESVKEKLETMAKKGGADYQDVVKKLISESVEAIGEEELCSPVDIVKQVLAVVDLSLCLGFPSIYLQGKLIEGIEVTTGHKNRS